MKIIPSKFSAVLYFTLFIFFLFSVISCSKKIYFLTSSVVPSAEGSIKIAKDANKNYTIDLNIKNLAVSERLTPPKKAYVVWMETENNGTKNIGLLSSNNSFFSSSLKAELHAVTPFQPKKVYITAENKGTVQFPGNPVVLSTKIFN